MKPKMNLKKYMDKKIILIFFISINLVLLYNKSFAQEYPKYVKVGDSCKVVPTTDTLWILTDVQVRKTIVTAKKYKISEEQNKLYAQQVATLKAQGAEKDSLILVLEKDRDYYKGIWESCSKDVETLGKISKRQAMSTKIAILAGTLTTIAAFFAGMLLFK